MDVSHSVAGHHRELSHLVSYCPTRGSRRHARRFSRRRVVFTTGDDTLVLTPASGQSHQGILFFPGAKVDPYSYLYPFVDVVAEGATLVVMEPLFNMALFDARDLEALTSPYPEINQWTLVGHSLGGGARVHAGRGSPG